MNIAYKLLRNINKSRFVFPVYVSTIQNQKNIHSNAKLSYKMYMEYENQYAYSLMESKGYAHSIKIEVEDSPLLSKEQFEKLLSEDWSKKSPKQLVEAFKKFSLYSTEHCLCISNKIFDDFIDNLTDNLKIASDDDLISVCHSLLKWPETESIRTRNYIEVWVALDDQCLNRIPMWTFDKLLNYITLFYMLNVIRVSDFSRKGIQKLVSKSKQLTTEQFVQTLFFIGVQRKQPFDCHNLQTLLQDKFNDFTVDELAIISMGFFKTKSPLRSMELVSQIVDKIIEHSKDIHEVSLAALLKIIRYSMRMKADDNLYKLLDVLQHEVPRLSVMCNVHIALLGTGTGTLILHKDCLTKIADRTINCMPKARLKDFERLILTFGTFTFKPPTKECFFEKVMEELRKPEREPEIEKHGRSFNLCIAYLSLLEIYPVDLMSKALSSEFLNKVYGKQCFLYGREVLTIHNSAKIFCAEHEMNRLTDKAAIILAKKYTDYVPSNEHSKSYNNSEQMYLDVFNILLETRGGNDFIIGDHILSHHQRGDIIICNNQEGQPLPVIAFSSQSFGLIRRPPDSNNWIVLVIAGRNALIHNSDVPTGHYQAKIRELKAIGYQTILVPWIIYTKLKTEKEKSFYLNGLINQSIT